MTNDRKYDPNSADSITKYANSLTNNSLAQVIDNLPADAYKTSNKGGLGSMVEEYFFEYKPGPNFNHEPDFNEAGVELKVTGVLKKKTSSSDQVPYKAKERLVLTMISYLVLSNEEWDTSSFLKKCRTMLILFYLYEKEVPIADLKFVIPPLLWNFPDNDMAVIKKDWLIIQQKVNDGLAHELSEGDTFYLSACRKGKGGSSERLREQPFSSIPAKSRAFSLKPSYVNTMIATAWNNKENDELLTSMDAASEGIEGVTLRKFNGLEGLTISELSEKYGISANDSKSKSYYHSLVMRILGTKKKYIPEFNKAGINIKTIRLQHNGTPKESMSFPAFNFLELIDQEWIESDIYSVLNQKFLFVIFQYDENKNLKFKKVMFWNMPYVDRLVAYKAWIKTRNAIKNSDTEGFPKMSDRSIVHVRPHGRNRDDVLPFPDGSMQYKRCFWLNANYIKEIVKN